MPRTQCAGMGPCRLTSWRAGAPGSRGPDAHVRPQPQGSKAVTCVLGHRGEGGRCGGRLPVPVRASAGVAAQRGQSFQGLDSGGKSSTRRLRHNPHPPLAAGCWTPTLHGPGCALCEKDHPQGAGSPRRMSTWRSYNCVPRAVINPGQDTETSTSGSRLTKADRLGREAALGPCWLGKLGHLCSCQVRDRTLGRREETQPPSPNPEWVSVTGSLHWSQPAPLAAEQSCSCGGSGQGWGWNPAQATDPRAKPNPNRVPERHPARSPSDKRPPDRWRGRS